MGVGEPEVGSVGRTAAAGEDDGVLRNRIAELEAELAGQLATLYLDNRMWDTQGSFSPEVVQANIDFLTAAGALPPGLTVAQVADFSYLEAVRSEIAR